MTTPRLEQITTEYTIQIVKAATADDPEGAIRTAAIALAYQGLTESELLAVSSGTVGNLAGLIRGFIPEGVTRQQFATALTAVTNYAALKVAIRNLPRHQRRTVKKGRLRK